MPIEEEDKLGSHSELFADLYEQITKGRDLIAWHNVLVKSMAHNGYLDAAEAESLLVRLKDSQDLHEKYLKKITSRKNRRQTWLPRQPAAFFRGRPALHDCSDISARAHRS